MKSSMSSSNIGALSGGGNSKTLKDVQINDRIASLRQELNTVSKQEETQGTVESLQQDLKRRQESYIRRQRQYEEKISSLEDEIDRLKDGKSDWMEKDENIKNIRTMHSQLMKNVSHVQDNTARVLKEQERDLLRAFRARLFDIQSELEVEKSKANVGASSWIEKNRQLERGLDWAKEMADRLERVNQSLTKENNRLKSQFKTQEDDREFLIRQLVAVKKDNIMVRQELDGKVDHIKKLEEEIEGLQLFKKQIMNQKSASIQNGQASPSRPSVPLLPSPSARGLPSANVQQPDSQPMTPENEARYKEIIKRLKKLLDTERKNLQKVRSSYSCDLKKRTELEVFLRDCVDDIRRNIAKEQKMAAAASNNLPHTDIEIDDAGLSKITATEFNSSDRTRTLDLLLSKERVVSLLYKKTFPKSPMISGNTTPKTALNLNPPPVGQDDIDEIYNGKK